MKFDKFRVISLITALSCLAAWPVVARIRVTAKPQSTTSMEIQHAESYVAPAMALAQVNERIELLPSGVSDSVRELSAPPESSWNQNRARQNSAKPSAENNQSFSNGDSKGSSRPEPNKKRQVVDLRDRIASNAFEIRATSISSLPQSSTVQSDQVSNQNSTQQLDQAPTPQWVDLTIPSELFQRAQMSPNSAAEKASSPQTPQSVMDRQQAGEAAGPTSKPIQQPEQKLPESKKSSAPPAVRDLAPPPMDEQTTKGNSNGPPTVSRTELEIPVRSRLNPDQAIPNWVYDKAGVKPPDDTRDAGTRPNVNEKAESVPASPAQEPVYAVPKSEPSANNSILDPARQLQPPASHQQPVGPSRANPNDLATPPNPSGPKQTVPTRPMGPPSQSGTTPDALPTSQSPSTANSKKNYDPVFCMPEDHPSEIDQSSCRVGYCWGDFSGQGGPQGNTFDACAAAHVYRGKFAIKTQRPLVELWRPLYTAGVYPPAKTWFGVTNPMKPHFMVYGDARTAVGFNHNANGKSNVWGNVLNLDMDLQLTSTERIHAFVSPLNRATKASGVSFNDGVDLIDGTNFNFNTLFFEGDAGALVGGANGTYPPFDLPFTFGLIPLVYQNGIWANDAMLGAAMAIPAKHSNLLKWSNFDASIFWATDNITTDAFPGKDHAADLLGTAWFIDAYDGYIEADYAFVNDNTGNNLGYHNMSLAFTRRYLARLSNSVRFIVNAGQQDLAKANRTADGNLLLIENSFITAYPNTIVPYFNLFYGQGRPQSLARAGVTGGILTNTGINFETDGITGYPTLDPTGRNTLGFASGVNLLGSQFKHQLVLEFAMLQALGSQQFRNAKGDEYGFGVRYQKPLSNNLIFRTDQMVGLRDSATNITGSRFELRWKF